ncbi:MAG TPA: hypothetical protein VID73_04000 [Ktedonobacterales bacterium]|jgi:hypothetical protein
MEQNRYERDDTARGWADDPRGPDAGLADHLRRLALPQLQGALREPALVHTVRELPPTAPLAGLAQALADDALRRALRLVGGARSYQREARTPDGWHLAHDGAVGELISAALDGLRDLRASAPRVH